MIVSKKETIKDKEEVETFFKMTSRNATNFETTNKTFSLK